MQSAYRQPFAECANNCAQAGYDISNEHPSRCMKMRKLACACALDSVHSGINPVQRPGERDRLTHVLEAANPRHAALNAHSEPGVRNAAVLAQVEIPLEGSERQVVGVDACFEQTVIVDALRAADDLAVAL